MIPPDERSGEREEQSGPAASDGRRDDATAGPPGSRLPEMSSPALEPLRSLGKYLLLEELGRGGMRTVFKAKHAPLDRFVAVKVLTPALRIVTTCTHKNRSAAKTQQATNMIGLVHRECLPTCRVHRIVEPIRQEHPLPAPMAVPVPRIGSS